MITFILMRFTLLIFASLLVFALFASLTLAFTGPTSNPPTGGGAIGVASNAPQNALYIASDGSIGVATTSPNQKLYVAGNLHVTGTIAGSYTGTISAANVSSGSFGSNTGGGNYTFLANLTVDTNTLFVNASTDRVGIGNTDPTVRLDVFGGDATFGSRNPGNAYIQDFAKNAVNPSYSFRSSTTTGMFLAADFELGFSAGSAGGEKVRITSGGNVGIGETAPGSKLAVSGGASIGASYDTTAAPTDGLIVVGKVGIATSSPSDQLHVIGNATVSGTLTAGTIAGSYSGTISAANVSSGSFAANTGGGNFTFPANLTVDTDTFFVDSTNNRVGVGTTTPSTLFSVATSTNIFNVTNSNVGVGDSSPSALFTVGSGDLFQVISTGEVRGIAGAVGAPSYSFTGDTNTGIYSGGADILKLVTAGSDRVTIDASGNVGVASTTPNATLAVQGTLSVTATSTLSGNWSLGGAAQGNVNLNSKNITAVNKLTVTTIDPLYDIAGVKYATYVLAIAGGVKEETSGKGKLIRNLGRYQYAIDFTAIEHGSDLWLWYKTVDFSKENVEAIATPYGAPARIWYEIDGSKLTFYGDAPVEFSFRLTGKRFDWRSWPTLAPDQSEPATLFIK